MQTMRLAVHTLVLVLLLATCGLISPSFATENLKVYGDATVSTIPGVDYNGAAVVYARSRTAFHLMGTWTLAIHLQRQRTFDQLWEFTNALKSIDQEKCRPSTDHSSEQFCLSVAKARAQSISALGLLFPDAHTPADLAPSNTSVFVPELPYFQEVGGVVALWRQLDTGSGQPGPTDRFAVHQLAKAIAAEAERALRVAETEAATWDYLLANLSVPASSSLLPCHLLEDAVAHAETMLPPASSFENPLSCNALPPLSLHRSEREVILKLYLNTGKVCDDLLAFSLPAPLNESHFLSLAIQDGAQLSCSMPETTETSCIGVLYDNGHDDQRVCSVRPQRADRAIILRGMTSIYVVAARPISVVFKFKDNETVVTRRDRLQGRVVINFNTTSVLFKGMSPDPLLFVKLVLYKTTDVNASDFQDNSAVFQTASFVVVLSVIILGVIIIPLGIFFYFLYVAYNMMTTAV